MYISSSNYLTIGVIDTMLAQKNTYKNILDIKYALEQTKQIVIQLEKENMSLKNTLSKVNQSFEKQERILHYQHHIYKIREE